MQINAIFHRKESQFEPRACTVKKIIELEPDEYEAFRNNMLQDRQFIAEFSKAMRAQGKSSDHCLLVLGEEHEDGVLVNTEGFDYARYAAFIPGARELLLAEEMHEEQRFSNQVRQIKGANPANTPAWFEHIRELAESNTGAYGPDVHVEYLRLLRDFGSAFRRMDQRHAETPAEIFNYKPSYQPEELLPAADWISNGGAADEAYELAKNNCFNPRNYAADRVMENRHLLGEGKEYCFSIDEILDTYSIDGRPIPLFVEELLRREGLASLDFNEESGEFTVRFKPHEQTTAKPLMQEDLTVIYARHILWCYDQPDGARADFSGQVLSELDFEGMSLCDANFAGATIQKCRMGLAVFDGSDFTGAKLRDVSAYQGEFIGAKFTGATLEYCEFAEAQFDSANFSQAEITSCTGLDEISQGPAMEMGG